MDQARIANAVFHFEKAIFEGDVENGWIMAGQCCGAITEIPSCQEVIERTVAQAEEILTNANNKYALKST